MKQISPESFTWGGVPSQSQKQLSRELIRFWRVLLKTLAFSYGFGKIMSKTNAFFQKSTLTRAPMGSGGEAPKAKEDN